MTNHEDAIRLAAYDLPDGKIVLPDGQGQIHFVYVKSGSAQCPASGDSETLVADEGRFLSGEITVHTGSEVWLYEKAGPNAPYIDAEIVYSQKTPLGFDGAVLVRADRIEFPQAAQTPRHGHRGPGLRRLVRGQLHAELGDTVRRVRDGEVWFENGPDPVVGTNTGEGRAVFVRLIVLPGELSGGKSSFMPMGKEEARKPRGVDLRLFGEILPG